MSDVNQVQNLINAYLDAYNDKDIEKIKQIVANDETLVAYGTDEGEIWHGWNEFSNVTKKILHAVEEVKWHRGTPKIYFSNDGNVAWFSEELSGHFTVLGDEHKCPIRFTGVAVNTDGAWKIVQMHRSCAVEGHSVPYLETHGVRFD